MATERIIPDRGEFVDALRALRRGRVMVRVSPLAGGCVIDGRPIYHSAPTLLRYGIVQRWDNPDGFDGVEYYRLSPDGDVFAERALETWRHRPLLERLAVRIAG
ncbi:hypothetical protein ACPOLB_16000 [Rubrivivax sp. RP6-9]|uniref:hypothetical protein n=1 Tax=Rubrivivax sp. RP6-9 TaxID=3415750 RepID=UPI003CC62F14